MNLCILRLLPRPPLPPPLGLSVPLRGPLFFFLLFRPSYCSVEGEFLFSLPSLSPFPVGEKEALRIPRALPLSYDDVYL